MTTSISDSKIQTDTFRFDISLSPEEAILHLKSDDIHNIRCGDFHQTKDAVEFKVFYGRLFNFQFVAMGYIHIIDSEKTSIKLVWEREFKSVPIWQVSSADESQPRTATDVMGKYVFNRILKLIFLLFGGVIGPIVSSITFALFGTFSFINRLDTFAALGFAASIIILISVGIRSYLDSNESVQKDTELLIWQEAKSRIMSHLTHRHHVER